MPILTAPASPARDILRLPPGSWRSAEAIEAVMPTRLAPGRYSSRRRCWLATLRGSDSRARPGSGQRRDARAHRLRRRQPPRSNGTGSVEPADANAPVIAGDRVRTTDRAASSCCSPTARPAPRRAFDRGLVVADAVPAGWRAVRCDRRRRRRSRRAVRIRSIRRPLRRAGPEARASIAVSAGQPAGRRDTELAVVRGSASLVTERGRRDAFARASGRSRSRTAPVTARRLQLRALRRLRPVGRRAADAPRGLGLAIICRAICKSTADALDRYGSWQYTRPTGMSGIRRSPSSWRPYYDGNWSPIRSYGWTWIGVDAWSWPTHHYGRWGHARGRLVLDPGPDVGTGVGVVGERRPAT